ncbi:hypothetical protein E4U22_007864 [Claviceps purpurea]|uniref:Protein SQS1 n=1 Tax=Claviceps purpurea (strain 20.1) TaxID=1111077 RepID=M1WDF1_CLAP2|nr:hypothetical protein E4U22_007864 [Claviceps purpurea]CCE34765.1 uncharacterized protein CPUR_08701 [Claviceps purpurea 20.1]
MARSRKVNRQWKNETGNFMTRGGREQLEHCRHIAATGTSAHKNRDCFSEHKTMLDEHDVCESTLVNIARGNHFHDRSILHEENNLRNRPVHFVSCGSNEPLESISSDERENNPTNIKKAGGAVQHIFHAIDHDKTKRFPTPDITFSHSDEARNLDTPSPCLRSQATGHQIDQNMPTDKVFVIDTTGKKMTRRSRQGSTKLPRKSPSPESSSGDDIILFRGRKSHSETLYTENDTQRRGLPTIVDDARSISQTFRHPMTRKNNIIPQRGEPNRVPTDLEDILLDYIANIRENGELEQTCNFQNPNNCHDLDGSDDDLGIGTDRSGEQRYGGSHFSDDDGHQHPDQIASTSDRQHVYHLKENDDDNLSNSSDDHDALATSVANQMLRSNSVSDMNSFLDSSTSVTQKKSYALTQQEADFDILDRNRPSVQRVRGGKGVRAKDVGFSNCDSDLEQQLQVAWKNDRRRKKERKQQRDELRVLGLLRKKNAVDDLKLKYPSGMSILQVAQELRSFLQKGDESVTFPPMDAHSRKVVHELAQTFNIKSKSIGKGEQRRPSLYRTARTLPYSEAAFDQAAYRIHRKFLPRVDTKGKSKTSSKKQNKLDTPKSATDYLEGEIVGAAAPELGIGNRGRAMLEKMGWSCGTALGAEDNKGILQPVSLTMKRSKAGLG